MKVSQVKKKGCLWVEFKKDGQSLAALVTTQTIPTSDE